MTFNYNAYIDDVLSNRVIACKMLKLAVKRHVTDLEKSKKTFPYYFDDKAAQNAIKFFSYQVHTKGKLARTRLKPEPWQEFVLSQIYGWKRKDNGKRRFRRVYLQVARKNGKTFFASGVGLYDMLQEHGAEVYSAATKHSQATIAFTNAKNTVKYSSLLSEFFTAHAHTITLQDSKFEALSSDSKMQDGLNPSCAIIDEYHAHKTDDMLNVIQSGMGAREQPLIFIITTAGHELSYPCHEEYERCCKMLMGHKGYENDNYLAIIYELDKGDAIDNPKNWRKANPNLDIDGALSTADLMAEYKNAQQKSSAMAEFMTKRLDLWVNNSDAWIDAQHWARCYKRFNENKLMGLSCYGGIDLSKRTDFTAYTLYFRLPDGKKYAKHHFYIPEEQIERKMKNDTYLIRKWIKDGYITATPGEVVDYNFLYEDIRADAQKYFIQEIAYDRNLSELLIEPLANSFVMVDFNQSITHMSEPSKAWETTITKGEVIDNNPVMAWMVSCATISRDANDNIKVKKPNSDRDSKRIDGVITSIMANDRLSVAEASNVAPVDYATLKAIL